MKKDTITTNKLTTKEGYQVISQVQEDEVYHFVPREERLKYLEQNGLIATIDKLTVKDGVVFCRVIIEANAANYHGTASCRLDNTKTDDHAGLAFSKAVDNALRVMGVGLRLKNGASISTLNRLLTPEEKNAATVKKMEQVLNEHIA